MGAILADGAWGKYKTILYLSIVYACGNAVVSITSVSPIAHDTSPIWWGGMLGLTLIGFGTGGIKPCVASFGGDQLTDPDLIQGYFSAFYFAINAGALLSTLITPKLRANVSCFGDNECYPLAFGIPSVLMIVATTIFVIGRKRYIIRMPSRNVILDTGRVWAVGFKNKFADWRSGGTCLCNFSCILTRFSEKSSYKHWLDPAIPTYGHTFVDDVKALGRVLVIFLPVPIYWTLYDQQGSSWTLQAEQLKSVVLVSKCLNRWILII